MIEIIIILCICIFIMIFYKNNENYQIIDVVKDTCRLECINRGYSYKYCHSSSKFIDDCVHYMVLNVVGPLPKNLYLEDIYSSYQTSHDSK